MYHAAPDRESIDAKQFVWYAIRKVVGGRQTGMYQRKTDALSHAWLCGLMGEATDRKARRPLEIAALREMLRRLKEAATAVEREMLELLEQEPLGTGELAERLGKTPGRISQLRRQLFDKSKE